MFMTLRKQYFKKIGRLDGTCHVGTSCGNERYHGFHFVFENPILGTHCVVRINLLVMIPSFFSFFLRFSSIQVIADIAITMMGETVDPFGSRFRMKFEQQ